MSIAGAKMVTIKACMSSPGKGSDWIRDPTPEDLRNRLVRG